MSSERYGEVRLAQPPTENSKSFDQRGALRATSLTDERERTEIRPRSRASIVASW